MRHILFSEDSTKLSTAILIKESSLNHQGIYENYISKIEKDISPDSLVAFSLEYDDHKKVKVSTIKKYLVNLLKAIDSLNITTLLVADGNYFKVLTKERKAEPHYGYIKQCKIEGYEHLSIILAPNYQALFYNPALQNRLDMSLDTLVSHIDGSFKELGSDIIKSASYPQTENQKIESLEMLFNYISITCDIETTSLRFEQGVIGTIAFAWNKHEGIAFDVDDNILIHLKNFFESYPGDIWFHNALFDVKFLIYHLYMNHSTDYIGLQKGLDVFSNIQDTMVLTYLATNSTAEAKLSLKDVAFEFTGNYAQEDINDITKIPLDELLEYNLVDCLATWYVHDKYMPLCIADNQMNIYYAIMQPSLKVLLKMMMIGLPMDLTKVTKAKDELETIRTKAYTTLMNLPEIKKFQFTLQCEEMVKANKKLKKKVKSIDEFRDTKFNPGSTTQKQKLLYQRWNLPVIDLTDSKEPATGAKTLAKLLNIVEEPEHKIVLESLIEISKVDIILNNFIKNFQEMAFTRNDNTVWLNGNLKLGGTQSGRLSSNNPNMQNIPSGSTYAKLIKSCFVAPEGWLFAGADFSALEDRIGAILSGDPMKTKEFSEGADGHSLRAIAFFSQLEKPVTINGTYIDPDVIKSYDIDDVTSINQFKKDHPNIRKEAKAPSFALQYGGTWKTLVTNIGLPEEVARSIEKGYHELYKGLSDFTDHNMKFGSENGYVKCAFGLRLRTPILARTILGKRSTPYEAMSEGRSASNAVSQSWGMLMNRALIATENQLQGSGYEQDIYMANTIHDAGYFIIRNKPDVIKWLNDTLIKEMSWNGHPSIHSENVLMEAELDIGKSWDKQYTLHNNATIEEIEAFLQENSIKDN
jgi:DNA polymerase-1